VAAVTATDWRLAEEHAQRCFDEERWSKLVRNCRAARDKHVRAAEEARRRLAATPATSGNGWRLRTSPHEDVESLAKNMWSFAMHGLRWPDGWRVRYGDLSHALGMTVHPERLFLVDERKHTHLRDRTRELIKTIAEELAHYVTAGDGHGPRWRATYESLVAYVLEPEEPAGPVVGAAPVSAPTAARPDLEALVSATKGRKFGPFGFGLDPDLEYRG